MKNWDKPQPASPQLKRMAAPYRTLAENIEIEKQALKTMPYHDYLKTHEWHTLRQQVLLRDAYSCRICACPDNLEVHHRSYKRRGEESLSDLIVLCADCHQSFHDNRTLSND